MKIIAHKNVSSEGITLCFDEPFALNGGLSTKEWWFSWSKLSEFIKARS